MFDSLQIFETPELSHKFFCVINNGVSNQQKESELKEFYHRLSHQNDEEFLKHFFPHPKMNATKSYKLISKNEKRSSPIL